MPKLAKLTVRVLLALAVVACICACSHIDDDRIPPAAVYIPFKTVGEWQVYGVAGAMDYRYFVQSEGEPKGYPYPVAAATGFGGVLLACDVNGLPVAYDMACPVECRYNVRVRVVKNEVYAECPVCHSTYNVFITPYGYPLSGPAAQNHYGLATYIVAPGSMNEFMIVTR